MLNFLNGTTVRHWWNALVSVAWNHEYATNHLTDKLEPPSRALDAPLRFPVTNVFRGQTATSSGFAVAGRLASGVVQVGERLRVVPGDETAVVKRMLKVLCSQYILTVCQ